MAQAFICCPRPYAVVGDASPTGLRWRGRTRCRAWFTAAASKASGSDRHQELGEAMHAADILGWAGPRPVHTARQHVVCVRHKDGLQEEDVLLVVTEVVDGPASAGGVASHIAQPCSPGVTEAPLVVAWKIAILVGAVVAAVQMVVLPAHRRLATLV